MKRFALAFVLCTFGGGLIGCGGGGGGGGNATTVDVTPNTAQVQAGGQQQFTANVHHAHGDKSVTWSLSGTGCTGAACGAIDSATANPVTYTAPAAAPSSNLAVTLTATSADGVPASASITVLALAVSVSPNSANVAVNTTQQFTATVVSDPSNGGINRALTQGGVACAPACGTISANSALSGAPITYTAPTTVPASATVTLSAASVANANVSGSATITITSSAAACGSGSEALLSGQYSFLVQGFDASGPVAIAGSFIADGTGKITGGGEDINRTSGPQTNLTISSSGSSATAYSVGSDSRGCLTLVNSAGTTTVFRFALAGITGTPAMAGAGRIIEFDDANGTGTRGSGILLKQDVASFAASLSGVYAFGLSGGGSVGRFAIAGTVAAAGGNFTNGNADSDSPGGAVATNVVCAACGTYSTGLDANGRGTSTTTFPAPLITVHFAFYQVSADEAIFLSTDAVASVPIQSGVALREAVPGSYTNDSLSGNSVLRPEGFGGGGTSQPSVSIGLVTIPSSGNFSLILDQDFGGISTNNQAFVD